MAGMHHQGVFRVSGAQVEINHFKNTFESGELCSVRQCDGYHEGWVAVRKST